MRRSAALMFSVSMKTVVMKVMRLGAAASSHLAATQSEMTANIFSVSAAMAAGDAKQNLQTTINAQVLSLHCEFSPMPFCPMHLQRFFVPVQHTARQEDSGAAEVELARPINHGVNCVCAHTATV